jgi:hypothetical protein
MFTVGVFSGLFTGLPRFGHSRRLLFQRLRQSYGDNLAQRAGGFINVRSAILGCSKQQVYGVLGAPRLTSLRQLNFSAIVSQRVAFTALDEWYYVFDERRCSALMVRFELGRVRRVEFVGPAEYVNHF